MAWLQLLVAIGKWKGIWIPYLTHYSREPANTYSYDRCTNQGWRSYLNILKSNLGTRRQVQLQPRLWFCQFSPCYQAFLCFFCVVPCSALNHAIYPLSGRKAFLLLHHQLPLSGAFPEPLGPGSVSTICASQYSGLTSILTLITLAYNELFTCLSPPG